MNLFDNIGHAVQRTSITCLQLKNMLNCTNLSLFPSHSSQTSAGTRGCSAVFFDLAKVPWVWFKHPMYYGSFLILIIDVLPFVSTSTLICIHLGSENHMCVDKVPFILTETPNLSILLIESKLIVVHCTYNLHIYIYTYVCYCMLPNYQQWNIRSTGSAVGLADHTACRPRESKPGWLQMTSYIVDDSCWENNERFVWVHRHLHLQLGFINIMCIYIYMHIGDFDLIDIGCNYKNKNSQNKRTYIISWYNIIFYTCPNQRKWATSLCLVQGFCVQSLEPATETAGAQCPAISAME